MLIKVISTLSFHLLFFPCASFALKATEMSLLDELLTQGKLYTMGEFAGSGGFPLYYIKFRKTKDQIEAQTEDQTGAKTEDQTGAKTEDQTGHQTRHQTGSSSGSIIFVNGKGENMLKYTELFYDLHSRGFSPIYAYDHRGQGFSQPVSASAAPPLTENYYPTHRKDLAAFIRFVLSDEEVDPQRLFLIAHSMGGTVVLDYLQHQQRKQQREQQGKRQGEQQGKQQGKQQREQQGEEAPPPFKAMVFSAPLIKIKTNIISKFLLFMAKGWHYLFSSSWRFPSLRAHFSWSQFTNSRLRYDFSDRVTEELFPQAKSRGTSLKWLLESLQITDRLMDEENLSKLEIPLLILQSEEESFVSNSQMDIFCQKIQPHCQVEKISGKHEIFLERDGVRDQAINSMINFFLQR